MSKILVIRNYEKIKMFNPELLAKNRDEMQGTFNDIAFEGTKELHHSEVKRIAELFRFNYASGKIACRKAGIKVK